MKWIGQGPSRLYCRAYCPEVLAIAPSTAHQGELELARQTADHLAELVAVSPDNLILPIFQLEVAGLTKLKPGIGGVSALPSHDNLVDQSHLQPPVSHVTDFPTCYSATTRPN